MSRFSVLVIGPRTEEELKEVLEPYSEHLRVPPYVAFTRKDKVAERQKRIEDYEAILNLPTGPEKDRYDLGQVRKFLKLLKNMTDEEYWEQEIKYYDEEQLNENGEPVLTYNPNSKWDYWLLVDWLLTKQGKRVSQSLMRDIDWEGMEKEEESRHDEIWEEMQQKSDEEKRLFYLWRGERTKEEYFKKHNQFTTFAYVLDGKWYERGKMGWWAHVSDEINWQEWANQYAAMLKSIKGNTMLTTIDCHI